MVALTQADVVAGLVMLALNAYVILGGADFGAGVWDLLAVGRRAERQRAVIADGIGPIWEANHVWLILVVVLLFVCFPPVYARLSVELHIPLTLMLVGIVLRGSAFAFRAYDATGSAVQRHWGRVFSIASTITPVLLGMCVGALVSGALAVPDGAGFVARFVAPWTTPFAIATGFLTLALFAYLAAVYLTVEARDADLQEDFRQMAILGAVAVFAGAALVAWLGSRRDVAVTRALFTEPLAIPLHIVTGMAAVAAFTGLVQGRYRVARDAAVVQASAIVWGWGLAQYPALIPGVHTIASAAAPPVTLRLVLVGLAGGAVVLVPSFWYLYKVFKGAEASAFVRMDTAEHETPE